MRINILYCFLLVVISFNKSKSQRRILDGQDIKTNKRYMAYLIKAPVSPNQYDEWICGGAIVSPIFIVTSAACVEDIQYMYAIAGYKKYVPAQKLNEDPCTKEAKKKIVFTCVPKAYDLDYTAVANWSFVDIAAVKVESPYKFDAPAPSASCSWVPDLIEVNFDERYARDGTDTLAYGWGHKKIWRQVEDNRDYNQELLQWGSTVIIDKNKCKESYSKIPGILSVIDKYMICTEGDGGIGEDGRQINKPILIPQDGCNPGPDNTNNISPSTPSPNNTNNITPNNGSSLDNGSSTDNGTSPNNGSSPNKLLHQACNPLSMLMFPGLFDATIFKNFNIGGSGGAGGGGGRTGNYFGNNYVRRKLAEDNSTMDIPYLTRRNGICQNDHGGPLVTWVGSSEVLIGIASVFLVQPESRQCDGPFLFTSTHCNSAFLACVLSMFDENKDKNFRRGDSELYETFLSPEQQWLREKREDIIKRYELRGLMNKAICDLPSEKRGFDLVSRRISWAQHPDGPAENELADDLLERPQIPLNLFHTLT